jgi:hypothetical protein
MKKVYEVVFAGFDGSTDRTDHLIVWIESDSYDAVIDFVSDTYPIVGVNVTPYTTKDKCADLII